MPNNSKSNNAQLPKIMGIVNVTPDSFSDGGQFLSTSKAIEHALRLVEEGADIIDIGGESTRPGAETIPVEEELKRVIPVIEGLSKRTTTKISVDTRKAQVMEQAIEAGCHIINDVSALTYDDMSLSVLEKSKIPVILMHAKGTPKNMQDAPQYEDVIEEITQFFTSRISACLEQGILKENIIIDPGIGFGKTLDHNLSIMKNIDKFLHFEPPILIGASRKRFIGELTNANKTEDRLGGSLATAIWCADKGANILRVHDVAATKQALDIWAAFTNNNEL